MPRVSCKTPLSEPPAHAPSCRRQPSRQRRPRYPLDPAVPRTSKCYAQSALFETHDAIVNAAHESLEVGGGVNGAIHRAAGPELLAECRKLGGCTEGNAKLTKGARLLAHYVVHTVAPIWAGGAYGEANLLAFCYRRSLDVAAEHGIKTIAFPSLATGLHGYDMKAAKIAVNTVNSCVAKNTSPIQEVIFWCLLVEDLVIHKKNYGRRSNTSNTIIFAGGPTNLFPLGQTMINPGCNRPQDAIGKKMETLRQRCATLRSISVATLEY